MSTKFGDSQRSVVDALSLPSCDLVRNVYLMEADLRLRDNVLSGYSLGTMLLARAAEECGARVEWVMKSIAIAVLQDGSEVLIRSHRSSESVVATAIERDKYLTAQTLRDAGVAAPQNIAVQTLSQARRAWQDIGGPVVVKPRHGFKGRGVTVGVDSADGLDKAFGVARRIGKAVVIEDYIEGNEYRVIASSKESFGVLARISPHVVGDGVSTIQQLVEQKNSARRLNPHTCDRLIPLSDALRQFLAETGRKLSSVPSSNEHVRVLGVSNFSQGGEAFECAEYVESEITSCAVEAVAAVPGLPWGAVDVIVSTSSGKPYVLEINTDGGLGGHTFPAFGVPKSVAKENWNIQRKHVLSSSASTSTSVISQGGAQLGPVNVADADRWARFERARLSRYARNYLKREGFEMRRVSNKSYRFFEPQSGVGGGKRNAEYWLVDALTLADKQAVVESVGRFYMQRRILAHKGVPRVEGRSTSSQKVCAHLVEDYGHASVTGWGADWHGPLSLTIEHQNDLSKLRWDRLRGVYVQQRPGGVRWRVLADRGQAYTMFLLQSDESPEFSMDVRQSVAELAVEAVLAFPELRWAGVDILVPADKNPLVEGMTLNPRLPSSLVLAGGDLDSFLESILIRDNLKNGL